MRRYSREKRPLYSFCKAYFCPNKWSGNDKRRSMYIWIDEYGDELNVCRDCLDKLKTNIVSKRVYNQKRHPRLE